MCPGLHCSPGSSPSSVWPAAEHFFVMPPRVAPLVVAFLFAGCGPSLNPPEVLALARVELRQWQPVPNVDQLTLTVSRERRGLWTVTAVPGPAWSGSTKVTFPLFIDIDDRGNTINRM